MECEYCDRKFKYRKSFVNHMQIEHGISDTDSDVEKVTLVIEKTEEQQEEVVNSNTDIKSGGNYC